MSDREAWEREAARATREVTRRAIRRLDIFEWVVLAVAMGLAVAGGWLVAWVLVGSSGGQHRVVWMIVSVILAVVPGAIVFGKRRQEEQRGARDSQRQKGEDG